MIPIRIHVDTTRRSDSLGRFAYSAGRCAILPCRAKATTVYGARPACQSCADESRAFIESLQKRELEHGVKVGEVRT